MTKVKDPGDYILEELSIIFWLSIVEAGELDLYIIIFIRTTALSIKASHHQEQTEETENFIMKLSDPNFRPYK